MNLVGVDNLTSVGGYLSIQRNDALTDLSALYSVVLSGETLTIQWNDVLPTANAWALDTQLRANGFSGETAINWNGP